MAAESRRMRAMASSVPGARGRQTAAFSGLVRSWKGYVVGVIALLGRLLVQSVTA
jgi:hypothetical protein